MAQPPLRSDGPYKALVSDGDGTLLTDKKMSAGTVRALQRLRASGRKLVLATGENPDELAGFPRLDLFDLVVAENGAALYWPGSKDVRLLTEPPPARLVRLLAWRGVDPLTAGRVIVCTKRPQGRVVNAAIRELGLDWEGVFNRDQLMLVPAGVDKATGLAAAAAELGLSAGEFVGVGDGENDGPLLRFCGCGAAVASGVRALKEQADMVTAGGAGDGVIELIDRLIGGTLPRPRGQASAGR